MISLNQARNWLGITLVAFIGIIGMLLAAKTLGNANVPFLSPIAAGTVNAWRVAA